MGRERNRKSRRSLEGTAASDRSTHRPPKYFLLVAYISNPKPYTLNPPFCGLCLESYTLNPPFCGLYLESYKVIPKGTTQEPMGMAALGPGLKVMPT